MGIVVILSHMWLEDCVKEGGLLLAEPWRQFAPVLGCEGFWEGKSSTPQKCLRSHAMVNWA